MSTLLPLEIRLQRWANERQNSFPSPHEKYWDRYSALVSYLRSKVYPHINAGLACLSKSPGIYTDHGEHHFDEVVRYAGCLIEPTFGKGDDGVIEPYDLYLLLSAIRLHDAGNIDGREEHERRVYSLLKEAGAAVCPDDYEARLIAEIAQSHGGKTDSGDLDTIGSLSESGGFGPIGCNLKEVAALVRFSDEVCEHHTRASIHHIQAGTLPPANKLFHLYANGVKQARLVRDRKTFVLHLEFDAEHLVDRYPTPRHTSENPEEKYLLEDALDRIQKLDTERIYCNRFISPALRTDRIEVGINITRSSVVHGQTIRKIWKSKEFVIEERGYPTPNTEWRTKLAEFAGSTIASDLGVGSAK